MTTRQLEEFGVKLLGVYFGVTAVLGLPALLATLTFSPVEGLLPAIVGAFGDLDVSCARQVLATIVGSFLSNAAIRYCYSST